MSFFRTRFSTLVIWGMIPLAGWAGMPSTGCVCSNGHIKLFCGHVRGAAEDHSPAEHQAGCNTTCCGDHQDFVEDDSRIDADCCGGGFCCHGGKSDQPGMASKTCCQPILAAPSVTPEIVSVPCEQAPAVIATAEVIGALTHRFFTLDVADLDTGPPLDRVILFRSLLI